MWQHDNPPSTTTYRLTAETVPVHVSLHLLSLGLQMKHFFFEAGEVSLKKQKQLYTIRTYGNILLNNMLHTYASIS